jgi:glycosyltransferase involved in cell wall biosynthesis
MNLAFVITRFGPDVVGGAEQNALAVARLLAKDHKITVYATTTSVMGDWNTEFSAGVSEFEGFTIKRFHISKYVSVTKFTEVHSRINQNELLNSKDYKTWIEHSGQSDALFEDLKSNESQYDAVIFFQYFFGLSLRGWKLFPKKAILWPTAHEEGPLFAPPVRDMFQQIKKIFWCSEGEKMMVQRCLGITTPGHVIGCPVKEIEPSCINGDHSKKKQGVLCVGRIEEMKNIALLLSYFDRLKSDHDKRLKDLKLYVVGSNPMKVKSTQNVKILGKVSREKLSELYQQAQVLCSPSLLESFGLVLMEAWQHKTPVLVHGRCDVTRQYCIQSGGGLFFRDYFEFRQCLLFFLKNPKNAQKMGASGQRFVKSRFNTQHVKSLLEKALLSYTQDANEACVSEPMI